ncbi:hypothetical protein HYQ44_011371 [Verticillium longisporum]|nr:hypothetical protein HYQ44_011371 [Verticillium longisporum]
MEPKRIRHACSRCRRQKLRCDYQRPCPLCIRAGAQCTEATERTWRSNRPKSAAYQARHARPRVADEPCSSAQPDTVDAVELGRPKVSTATHAQPNDIVRPDQRASALHFVGKIFQKYQSQQSGLASRKQRPLLLLALVVLVIGAKFKPDGARAGSREEAASAELVSGMILAAERWYLPSMDLITVDTVSYSFLLSAYYMWNRQSRAAFITMGTTVRAAQFIGFNQEECWGDIDTVERQTRRYVWWSVFIGAGFISMSWGTPPMLIETDCHVQQPLDVEDSFEQCPKFGSTEIYEDGQSRPVTVGSYNRFKAKMYQIANSIMHQIYFTQHNGSEELCQSISKVHQRLLAWERSIPPELRSESHPPNTIEDGEDAALKRIFALQALTLQVSYDNV